MERKQHLGEDGHLIQLGGNVRLERGLAGGPDKPHSWFVYRKVDTSDDDETTENFRWEEVASFPETEPGEMPQEAMDRAEALSEE